MGVNVQEEYGGSDATFFSAVLVIQELAKVDPAGAAAGPTNEATGRSTEPRIGSRSLYGPEPTPTSELCERSLIGELIRATPSTSNAWPGTRSAMLIALVESLRPEGS